MENLNQYRERTAYMHDNLMDWGCFHTSEWLPDKVDADGSLKPFYGNTVIFDLSDQDKQWLEGIKQRLYQGCDQYGGCGEMLAQALAPQTFHITLHDLANGPQDTPALRTRIAETGAQSKEILASFAGRYPSAIRVRARHLFVMARTSVVMGFEPASQEDCAALMGMYDELQRVVALRNAQGTPLSLTLHVTLAYLRPSYYDWDRIGALARVFACEDPQGRECCLSLDALDYSLFASMNDYRPER